MTKLQSLTDSLTKGFNFSRSQMLPEEKNAILGMILSLFFGIISPHFSNRFFIRELFNFSTGLVILSSLYKLKNFILVLMGVPFNLLLAYVPIKRKSTRTQITLVFNVLLVILSYALKDSSDSSSFYILTVTAFFIKYMYIGMEYSQPAHGLASYFGYLFFTPGLKYGPVMSFSEYEKWLHSGYMYIIETADKKDLEVFIGETENETEINDRKEDYVIHQYSKMIAKCTFYSVLSGLFIITYRVIIYFITKSVKERITNLDIFVFYLHRVCYIGALWVGEQGIYEICFINNMENLKISSFFLIWKDETRIFNDWNIQGSKFVKKLIKEITEKDKKSEKDNTKMEKTNRKTEREPEIIEKTEKESKITENTQNLMKAVSIKDYIKESFHEFGHLFLFPVHASSIPICIFNILIVKFIRFDQSLMRTFNYPKLIINILTSISDIFTFFYFMIPFVYTFSETFKIWRNSLACGHFLCLPELFQQFLNLEN